MVSFFKIITDRLNFFFKKYVYTVNHKRIALNYFYFSFFSGLSGTFLATLIRFELAYPGSHFFKGDSIRYLQVITSHGLIMIFFVVVPLIFGFFANFFIPYHIGSKDVAFPRLNSLGF
jgi:cytochrome c oxidase subunit 1